jgi:hypothetical protein
VGLTGAAVGEAPAEAWDAALERFVADDDGDGVVRATLAVAVGVAAGVAAVAGIGVGVPGVDAAIGDAGIRPSSSTAANTSAKKRMPPTVGREAPEGDSEAITDD